MLRNQGGVDSDLIVLDTLSVYYRVLALNPSVGTPHDSGAGHGESFRTFKTVLIPQMERRFCELALT